MGMPLLDDAMRVSRLDFQPSARQPSVPLTALAIAVGVLLSLAASFLIVHLTLALFPALAGYEHFRFSDYARLTVIGSLIACAGWPVLTRVSSAPVRVYVALAVLGTLVLYLPDLYILFVLREPATAVAALMVMHVAVPLLSCASMIAIARR
ncbi:MAG: hypothetical protein J2P39_08070 [Candidatus Dormibacteraeota bacterium]|nr:hypothetical protein [Candidatus Dormibacteraeota bacterium]